MSVFLARLVNLGGRVQDAILMDASYTMGAGSLGALARSGVMRVTTVFAKQIIFALHTDMSRFLTSVHCTLLRLHALTLRLFPSK